MILNQNRLLEQGMLRDECKAFPRKEEDIGCIPELKLDITLNDKFRRGMCLLQNFYMLK